MKILVDENIPRMTVAALCDAGHEVRDVRGTLDEGISDAGLWRIAVSEQRVLITTDKGFATVRDPLHPGVLVVRLKQPNRQRIHDRVMQGITRYPEAQWPGMAVVMRDGIASRWRDRRK
jgi:predicted nuclease of predicted toxin-antitoxin system